MITINTEIAHKIGNSVGISIPNEFKIPIGQQYIIHKNLDNSFIMVPKIENPYTSNKSFVPDDNATRFERVSMKKMKLSPK